jgi:hypothetical protein
MRPGADELERALERLSGEVEELEVQVAARQAQRAQWASALQGLLRARRRLTPEEGGASWAGFRLVGMGVGLVLAIGGAWALDQTLGSAAIVAAFALIIWEAAV